MSDPLHQEWRARLEPWRQEHLLTFWQKLSPAERDKLHEQLGDIDFQELEELFHQKQVAGDWGALAARAVAPPAFRLGQKNAFSPEAARKRGEEALAAGKFGVVLVAGGQGTRLGFEHPKGMFPIGPVSEASLFQILVEQVVARARRHGAALPLCVMTSPATHEETVKFLNANDRFGLPAEDLTIFCQGTMPAVDAKTGKVLLSSPCELALSPDGHGGLLAALAECGALAALKSRGVEHLFYLQIDNPLVSVCDPEFIGYHLLANSELTTQVVAKREPREKVGNVAMIDGQMQIIEYSDFNPLSNAAVDRRTPAGEPIFWAGNVAVHVFDLGFLERMAHSDTVLPFHVAKKAAPHLSPAGEVVEPAEPNAIKFERFIFDLLPEAARPIVVEVDPRRSFAPLKNGPGESRDTAETVQALIVGVAREWLEKAGVSVAPGVAVEISPLLALDAEELAAKLKPAPATVEAPRYFR